MRNRPTIKRINGREPTFAQKRIGCVKIKRNRRRSFINTWLPSRHLAISIFMLEIHRRALEIPICARHVQLNHHLFQLVPGMNEF